MSIKGAILRNSGIDKLKALKSSAGGRAVGLGMSGLAFVHEYNNNRAEGDGVMKSAALGAGNAFIMDAIGMPAYIGISAVGMGVKAGGAVISEVGNKSRDFARANIAFSNSHFNDSQKAYTMRQSGMQNIQNAEFNTKKALMGNEARYMS